jgi:hypothetical protein
LEEVEQDSDESSNDDGNSTSEHDRQSVNADGQRIPNEETKWLSGRYVDLPAPVLNSNLLTYSIIRFCKANSEQAHALIHWKYALNQWVVGNLEQEGYLTPEKLAEREKMKAKKRREYANEVVDLWESSRQIKDLYRDFKNQLESAREAKQTRWSAGKFQGYAK